MSEKEIHIGVVMLDPRITFFWAVAISCLHTEAALRGIRVTVVPVNSVEEQVAELHKLLKKSIDALLIRPLSTDDAGLLAVVRKAVAAGIPVVCVDSGIAEEKLTSTVGIDNVKGQAMVAEHVFEHMGGRGKVAYFQGDLRMQAGFTRAQSFHQVLRRYPDIEVCYEVMLDWRSSIHRRLEGANHMHDALALHPDVRAVIAGTDESALGAIEAITEAGLEGQILVAGFDGIPEALLAIFNRQMLITARQAPIAIIRDALDTILKAVGGGTVAASVLTAVDLVTLENVENASLDTLQMVPDMIQNLADSSEVHKKLQQAVIATQYHILQTMAAISQAVSRIREPDEMMIKVVNLVCKRFDLHYAALYLVDRDAEAAELSLTLEAVSGDINTQVMVQDKLKIKPENESIIARCVRARESQLAQESDPKDKSFAAQRLPGVRSEAVLPLHIAGQIVGVLDVQSLSSNAFDDDVMMVLQTIVDQVSVALANANLYVETMQRAAEQEASSKFLDSIIDNMPTTLFLKDATDLRFLRWNKAGNELLGYTQEELIGKNDYDFFPKEQADFFTASDRRTLATGEMIDIPEEPVQTKHKGLRILHTKKIPLMDKTGKPEFLLGISEDVTERKNAEELLKKRAVELEQAYTALQENQEKLLIVEKMASIGRLTAGIAHEMNTPLASVRSAMSELRLLIQEYRDAIGDPEVNVKDHHEIADEMERAIKLANSSAERAAGFVRGVKSQTRDLSLQQLIRFNAIPVIQEAILLLSHALRNANCTVTLEAASDALELYGSPARLAQVVTNLICNAIDAKGDTILLTLAKKDAYMELRVSDNGYGIAPKIAPKIFDPMFTTKPFGQGTGLGLTIVHDIVTSDFGGSIELETQPGKGTTFKILLVMPQ